MSSELWFHASDKAEEIPNCSYQRIHVQVDMVTGRLRRRQYIEIVQARVYSPPYSLR